MEIWIPITIAAAFLQNVRSALQKYLKGRLSTTGATFVRFGYGFPLALLYAAFLHWGLGMVLPAPSLEFLLYMMAGGLSQILATFLLVALFSYRNFAVGTAYSKTEPVQAALFGLVLLNERLTPAAIAAIGIAVTGVMIISVARLKINAKTLISSLVSRSAVIGILSGALFGVSAVCYRGASLSLGGQGFLMQAAYTLAVVTLFQTLVMLLYMAFFERDQIRAVIAAWRPASIVGLAGVAGSACWFIAMTIQSAAYVRALGQIELVFTFAVSWLFFKERINRLEILGIGLILGGILLLLLGR